MRLSKSWQLHVWRFEFKEQTEIVVCVVPLKEKKNTFIQFAYGMMSSYMQWAGYWSVSYEHQNADQSLADEVNISRLVYDINYRVLKCL